MTPRWAWLALLLTTCDDASGRPIGRAPADCPPGYDDCDGDPANGCETSLEAPSHCGACGRACPSHLGVASCHAGACAIACFAGHADCDGDPGTGCETDVLSQPAHCGACGRDCKGATCTQGRCDAISIASDGISQDAYAPIRVDSEFVYYAGHEAVGGDPSGGAGGEATGGAGGGGGTGGGVARGSTTPVLRRVLKDGGQLSTLATLGKIADIGVGGSYLFVIDANNGVDARLLRYDKDGKNPLVLSTGIASLVPWAAVDTQESGLVCWLLRPNAAMGQVECMDFDGSGKVTLAAAGDTAWISIDEAHVWWVTPLGVWRVPIATLDAEPEQISSRPSGQGIRARAGSVFWSFFSTETDNGGIASWDTASAGESLLAIDNAPRVVLADASAVYWLAHGGLGGPHPSTRGALHRVRREDQSSSILLDVEGLDDLTIPIRLVDDDAEFLYINEGALGRVRKLAK